MTDNTFRLDLGFFNVPAGLDRAARFLRAMRTMPPEARREVLEVLDEVSRPMTPREIERALEVTDLNYRHRRAVVASVKHLNIIIMTTKDQTT